MSSNRLPLVIRIFVAVPLIRRTKRVPNVCVRVEAGAKKRRRRGREEEWRESIKAFTLPSKERMKERERDREWRRVEIMYKKS